MQGCKISDGRDGKLTDSGNMMEALQSCGAEDERDCGSHDELR